MCVISTNNRCSLPRTFVEFRAIFMPPKCKFRIQPLKGTGNPVTEPKGNSDKSGSPPKINCYEIN